MTDKESLLKQTFEREGLLACALQMYVNAHGFLLASEGLEEEDAKRMATRYRIAQEALERHYSAKADRVRR